MNNVIASKKNLSTIFEIENISKNIIYLEEQIKKIKEDNSLDKFDKKIKSMELEDKITELKSFLTRGIPINCDEIKQHAQNTIIEHLEPFGYDSKFILEKLKNVQFYVTNEMLVSGGRLSAVGSNITINYDLCNFDENGKFLNFKNDEKDFINYVIMHELLHVCSTNTKRLMANDSLAEGFTDMFARFMSKDPNNKSSRYDFLVRICTLLANVMGMENALSDYMNNLDTLPNTRKLFGDEIAFLEFYAEMNNILSMEIEKKDPAKLYVAKVNLIGKIKDNIFIPLLKSNIPNKEVYINLFNNLFSEFEITCNLAEIENIVK
jgi:hypothetical protein